MIEQQTTQRRVIPPVYFLVALIAMAVLHAFIPGMQIAGSVFRYPGTALLVGAFALVLWAAALFRKAGTTIKPFQASSALVTDGPYRFTRNPMYLGMVGTLLGVGLILGSAVPLVVIPVFAVLIERRFIRHEEAILERTFGHEYCDYKARVRRWL